jgi:tRNA pseudouridine38-40 synthase
VPSTFHARHSARAKTYEYRIFLEKPGRWTEKHAQGKICPPFLAPYVYACPWSLDVSALNEVAGAFVGEHDFLSFAATDPDLAARSADPETKPRPLPRPDFSMQPPKAPTIKSVFSSAWEMQGTKDGDLLVYRIRGSGFLHHMVRNLVGTMLDVGRGQLRAAAIPEIVAARRRSAAGPTAPARGLFLHSVEYDGAE